MQDPYAEFYTGIPLIRQVRTTRIGMQPEMILLRAIVAHRLGVVIAVDDDNRTGLIYSGKFYAVKEAVERGNTEVKANRDPKQARARTAQLKAEVDQLPIDVFTFLHTNIKEAVAFLENHRAYKDLSLTLFLPLPKEEQVPE